VHNAGRYVFEGFGREAIGDGMRKDRAPDAAALDEISSLQFANMLVHAPRIEANERPQARQLRPIIGFFSVERVKKRAGLRRSVELLIVRSALKEKPTEHFSVVQAGNRFAYADGASQDKRYLCIAAGYYGHRVCINP
jgi:hypothetical protein